MPSICIVQSLKHVKCSWIDIRHTHTPKRLVHNNLGEENGKDVKIDVFKFEHAQSTGIFLGPGNENITFNFAVLVTGHGLQDLLLS